MVNGITNDVSENLSRLLTIQMIFRIIVYHSILNLILASLDYCQSWIHEIKKSYVSCLIDLTRTVFSFIVLIVYFWNCEQINPASANGRTTLYLQTLQWAFPVVSQKLLTKSKRKRIQNVKLSLDRLELKSRERSGFQF